MLKRRRVATLFVSIVTLFAIPVGVGAQAPSPQVELAAATRQIRTGDSVGALFTLNRAVKSAAEYPSALARVHAYQVWAYISLDQPERAQAAVRLALKADSRIVIDPNELTPPVVALFDGVRHPARDPEAAGEAAEQAGRFPQAFLAYLNAFQSLPDPPAPADDRRLREKIITVVQKLPTRLIVPPEATEHLKKATDLLNAEAVLGASAATEQTAAGELRQAVRAAPWWPDATFQLATVLQKLQRVDEALLNLNLYKLADPAGYAAAVNRANPTKVDTAKTEPEPKPVGPAVIYVYWLHMQMFGIKPSVLCDGQRVADLENGHFVVFNASAGAHTIVFRDQKVFGQFEGGQTHYVRISKAGFPAHLVVGLTSPDEATTEMREKEITPNEPKRTFSTECKPASPAPKKSK